MMVWKYIHLTNMFSYSVQHLLSYTSQSTFYYKTGFVLDGFAQLLYSEHF
jgi:hypothetical protein